MIFAQKLANIVVRQLKISDKPLGLVVAASKARRQDQVSTTHSAVIENLETFSHSLKGDHIKGARDQISLKEKAG